MYNRLPFGLQSGPLSWQKVLDHVLQDVPSTFVYLDDILVWADTDEEHQRTIEEVFKKLAANNMAPSLDKCIFGQKQVEYLGYLVTSEGIHPLPKKLEALDKFPVPKSQKDVLHFCGALNYFRTSLKGVKMPDGSFKSAAAVLQPLYSVGTDKLENGTKFKEIWEGSPILQEGFENSKKMLRNVVELCHPNPNFPLALFTDASEHSVGEALTMLSPEGEFKPLGFYSAHLTPTQKKYSVFKKELLGAHKSFPSRGLWVTSTNLYGSSAIKTSF